MLRLLGVIVAVLVVDVRTADACAAAPPPGAQVRIAEEEALIIWDPDTKTEHFIRRAAFYSTARTFGFLVPTPTVPQLSEVPDWIFYSLADQIRPEVRYDRSRTTFKAGSFLFESCLLAKSAKETTAGAPGGGVRVLATANVAGFDATTVEADDAGALTGWLGSHGFEATPHLTRWLERYVTDKWKITAFVVAGDQEGKDRYELATKAVKMTFPAERPFYPYREPQIEVTVETDAKLAPPVADRMLRVFFVSTERYAATLGGQPWSAKVLHAAPITAVSSELAPILGAHRSMTVFVDDSTPRRGLEELYFARSADQAEVRQPPVIIDYPEEVTVPVDLIVVGVGLVLYVVVRRRRRRR